jgi:integrase
VEEREAWGAVGLNAAHICRTRHRHLARSRRDHGASDQGARADLDIEDRNRDPRQIPYGTGARFCSGTARWRGNLDAALPKPNKLAEVRHHAAVAVDDIVLFMARLRDKSGMGARALEFAILTAARSGEVRGAVWSELDLAAALWIVPAQRMKSGREHRVPLSKPAVTLLRTLPKGKPDDSVFPGLRGPLSDMSLTAVLRRMNVDATAHGFRSTFRDWASEHTNHTSEVAEMALAHAVGDKVEAAYRRGNLFEKRVLLMSDWAMFLENKKAGSQGRRSR